MSKQKFVNHCTEYTLATVSSQTAESNSDLLEPRYAVGTYVIPSPEDSVDIEWEAGKKPYTAIAIYTFDEAGMPNSKDYAPKSVFSYKSYGEYDRKSPLTITNTRVSNKGWTVPDCNLELTHTSFKFKATRSGKKVQDKEGKMVDEVKVQPASFQIGKVIGSKYVLVAEYDETMNSVKMVPVTDAKGVPVNDENGVPVMKVAFTVKRKPVFELVRYEDLPESMKEAIEEEPALRDFFHRDDDTKVKVQPASDAKAQDAEFEIIEG